MAYDPVGEENFKKKFSTEIQYVNTAEDALKDADVAFIFTEWKEIKDLGLNTFVDLMKSPIIYDGRNCFDVSDAENAEVDYYSVGRKAVLNYEESVKAQIAATIK